MLGGIVAALASAAAPILPNVVVPNASITQFHGEYPSVAGDATHMGLDLAPSSNGAACRSAVHSFSDGFVERVVTSADVDWFRYTGNAVMLRHTSSGPNRVFYSTYLHLHATPLVAAADYVDRGEPIGYMGSTGTAIGCHTHFELKDEPNWGYTWFEGATPRENIYGLGDVRKERSFTKGWFDPFEVFCQYPEGMSAADRLKFGCADIYVPPTKLKVTPRTATHGDEITVSFSVTNRGRSPTYPSTTRIRLSSRESVTNLDPLVAELTVSEIAPRGTEHFEATYTVPNAFPSGELNAFVILDVFETAGQHPSDTGNDISYSKFEIESRSPDLIGRWGPVMHRVVEPGELLSVRFEIRNKGKSVSSASQASIRISASPSRVTVSDPLLERIEVDPIASSGVLEFERRLLIPASIAPGRQYLYLVVDINSNAGQTLDQEANDKSKTSIVVRSRL